MDSRAAYKTLCRSVIASALRDARELPGGDPDLLSAAEMVYDTDPEQVKYLSLLCAMAEIDMDGFVKEVKGLVLRKMYVAALEDGCKRRFARKPENLLRFLTGTEREKDMHRVARRCKTTLY